MRKVAVRTITDSLKILKEIYRNDIEVYNRYIDEINAYAVEHNDRVDLSDEKVLAASKAFVKELCDDLWYSEIATHDIVYNMHRVCSVMTRLYKYAGLPVEFSYELEKPLVIF